MHPEAERDATELRMSPPEIEQMDCYQARPSIPSKGRGDVKICTVPFLDVLGGLYAER
jgi:hypothetical protein